MEKTPIETAYELLQQLELSLSPKNAKLMAVIYGKLEEAWQAEKQRAGQPEDQPAEPAD